MAQKGHASFPLHTKPPSPWMKFSDLFALTNSCAGYINLKRRNPFGGDSKKKLYRKEKLICALQNTPVSLSRQLAVPLACYL